ncbi:hypothetical protein OG871_38165 [Kitasatospora sp. NBC_00374]|uniref:hypothetical protein n=1 Tax=Kitasatospora sp. NBC_00374 TaxID=2975964 RepID=UPI00324966F3
MPTMLAASFGAVISAPMTIGPAMAPLIAPISTAPMVAAVSHSARTPMRNCTPWTAASIAAWATVSVMTAVKARRRIIWTFHRTAATWAGTSAAPYRDWIRAAISAASQAV